MKLLQLTVRYVAIPAAKGAANPNILVNGIVLEDEAEAVLRVLGLAEAASGGYAITSTEICRPVATRMKAVDVLGNARRAGLASHLRAGAA